MIKSAKEQGRTKIQVKCAVCISAKAAKSYKSLNIDSQ